MRPTALFLALLLTAAAAAEELYVPLASEGDRRPPAGCRGGVPAAAPAWGASETLARQPAGTPAVRLPAGCDTSSQTAVEITNRSARRTFVEIELLGGNTTRVALAGGERMQWSTREAGVLRIAGRALHVTAFRDDANAVVSVPVLSAREVVDEASVTTSSGSWRSGIVIVNPHEQTVVVTVDGSVQSIAPRGVLRGMTFQSETPLLAFAHDVHEATGAELFSAITPHARTARRRAVRSAMPPAAAQSIVLTPSKDNTLYESPNGEFSNGAGPHLFAGTTQSRARRRAVMAFDVASQLPPGTRITRVTLTMRVSLTISGPRPVTLHRVTTNWGEGTSNAGSSRDGGGASSTANDATWRHTFFPDRRWTNPGGDFAPSADATAAVGSGSSVWESAAMTARVQQWLDQPASNFGWIVIGDEASSGTAKRFDSREVQPGTSRPSLTIEFQR